MWREILQDMRYPDVGVVVEVLSWWGKFSHLESLRKRLRRLKRQWRNLSERQNLSGASSVKDVAHLGMLKLTNLFSRFRKRLNLVGQLDR